MDKYSVQVTKQALSDLRQLSVRYQKQIASDVDALKANPFPQGSRIKRLKGFPFPLYRLRCGDYRVLYRIDDRLVTILRVIDRKLLDRILAKLK